MKRIYAFSFALIFLCTAHTISLAQVVSIDSNIITFDKQSKTVIPFTASKKPTVKIVPDLRGTPNAFFSSEERLSRWTVCEGKVIKYIYDYSARIGKTTVPEAKVMVKGEARNGSDLSKGYELYEIRVGDIVLSPNELAEMKASSNDLYALIARPTNGKKAAYCHDFIVRGSLEKLRDPDEWMKNTKGNLFTKAVIDTFLTAKNGNFIRLSRWQVLDPMLLKIIDQFSRNVMGKTTEPKAKVFLSGELRSDLDPSKGYELYEMRVGNVVFSQKELEMMVPDVYKMLALPINGKGAAYDRATVDFANGKGTITVAYPLPAGKYHITLTVGKITAEAQWIVLSKPKE